MLRSPATQPPVTRLGPWAGWLVAGMAATVVLYAVDLTFAPLSADVSELFQKFASCAVFFGASALCAAKARASADERSAWGLFALAMALWGSASIYYTLFLWDRAVVPIPSAADGLWLLFYLPAYGALYKLLRTRAGSIGRGVWLDALVGALGVGGAAAAVVFGVVLRHTDGWTLSTATNLAYPIGDLGLLALVVAAVTVMGWKASGVWRWIAPAFSIFVVADSLYLVGIAKGTYDLGGILDLGWPVAALLVGLAAWRPDTDVRAGRRRTPSVTAPALSGIAALTLLVADHFVRTNPLALTLATASIFVMLVRLYAAVKENARLLLRSRVEASTDALTGLGNRRQMTTDLARRATALDPRRPVTLTLFDLDGFKHFNDTFGHQAGDELLQRLGGRLGKLLAGRGTAYRMGGDEFCAVWSATDAGDAALITMDAVAALSEQGDAYSLKCSYGSALMPSETTDPAVALRMADTRMYARKGSGRATGGRRAPHVPALRT
jgi:two-component system cell cycle response regulator